MDKIIDEIVKLENLHWAWEKAKHFYQQEEYWYDKLELERFSANYESEIQKIVTDILNGSYRLTPIRPIFFPKSADGEEAPCNRQMFYIAVRDQLVWLAVVNVIGKYYDQQMPYWSYGNRLYMSMFPKGKSSTGKVIWGYGPYRNSTAHTYQSFQQSWPRFRRDVYLTSKIMSGQTDRLKIEEKEDIQNDLAQRSLRKVQYKDTNFWNSLVRFEKIYWCNIDLSKFYPSLKISFIKKGFNAFDEFLRQTQDYNKVVELLNALLAFNLNFDGFPSDTSFECIQLSTSDVNFDGIPTGLFVAGFLANIAMLPTDYSINKIVEKDAKTDRRIAHFRYVDDHTFIAVDESALLDWVDQYKTILDKEFSDDKSVSCVSINWKKTRPEDYIVYFEKKYLIDSEFKDKYHNEDRSIEEIRESLKKNDLGLDPEYPTALMNHTLEKVSMIAHTAFNMLDEAEEQRLLQDLEHLLLADFPDEEIRRQTRVSFAASQLIRLLPTMKYDYQKIYEARQEEIEYRKKLHELKKGNRGGPKNEIKELEVNINIQQKKVEDERDELEKNLREKNSSVFRLLLNKTIQEYPDKVKLLKKAVVFYEKIGFANFGELKDVPKDLNQLLEVINLCRNDNKINEEARKYLFTFLYDSLSNSLVSSYKRSVRGTYRDIFRSRSFIKVVLNEGFLDELFAVNLGDNYYGKQSADLFKVILGTLIFIDKVLGHKNGSLIKKYGLIDWKVDPAGYCLKHDLNFDVVVLWLVSKFNGRFSEPPPNFLKKYLGCTKFDSCAAYSIVSLYPSLLIPDHRVTKKLTAIRDNNFFPFFWWHGVNKRITVEKPSNSNLELKKYLQFRKSVQDEHLNFIGFIDSLKSAEVNSELIALRVVDKILRDYYPRQLDIETILKDDVSLESKRINFLEKFPYCLYFHKDLLIPERSEKVKIIYFENDGLKFNDKRYAPDFINIDGNTDLDKKFFYAMGILLIQIISRDYELPNILYHPSNQLLHTNLLLEKLAETPISSYSYEIVKACLSKKRNEALLDQELFGYEDDLAGEFVIRSLDDVQVAVARTLKLLVSCEFRYGEESRYLIPIKLNELKDTDLGGVDAED